MDPVMVEQVVEARYGWKGTTARSKTSKIQGWLRIMQVKLEFKIKKHTGITRRRTSKYHLKYVIPIGKPVLLYIN